MTSWGVGGGASWAVDMRDCLVWREGGREGGREFQIHSNNPHTQNTRIHIYKIYNTDHEWLNVHQPALSPHYSLTVGLRCGAGCAVLPTAASVNLLHSNQLFV